MPELTNRQLRKMSSEERIAIVPQLSFLRSSDMNYKIRRYAKKCIVSLETAVRELRAGGIKISDRDVSAFKRYRAEQKRLKKEHREKRKLEKKIPPPFDSDETFAYIAGYTSGGAPFGITWEEMEGREEFDCLS